jgi:hypothetical protein
MIAGIVIIFFAFMLGLWLISLKKVWYYGETNVAFWLLTAGIICTIIGVAGLAYRFRMTGRVIFVVILAASLTAFPLLYGEYQIMQPITINFEKMTFTSVNASMDLDGNFTIIFKMQNTGTRTLTVNDLVINGTQWISLQDKISENLINVTLATGMSKSDCMIRLKSGGTWTSNLTIEIVLLTAAGMEFSFNVTLP